MPAGSTLREGTFALRFFSLALTVFLSSAALAWLLIRFGPQPVPSDHVTIPAAFWVSTTLLGVGSVLFQAAWHYVRREKQRPFRRCLLGALLAGTLFVAFQSEGLWLLLESARPIEAQTEARAFVFVFTLLHALHFTVALLFLVFVTVQAHADRYDHEYYWGVTVCAFFWHFLGIVWLAILGVLGMASQTGVV